MLPDEVKARVHLALQRVQLLKALQRGLAKLPVDQRDQKILIPDFVKYVAGRDWKRRSNPLLTIGG